MKQDEPLWAAAKQVGITVSEQDAGAAKQLLADTINDWLLHDFNRLIAVLYRMDINEIKLRQLLKDHPGRDAGLLIADMMIDRQLQKIKSREENQPGDSTISDEEKW